MFIQSFIVSFSSSSHSQKLVSHTAHDRHGLRLRTQRINSGAKEMVRILMADQNMKGTFRNMNLQPKDLVNLDPCRFSKKHRLHKKIWVEYGGNPMAHAS